MVPKQLTRKIGSKNLAGVRVQLLKPVLRPPLSPVEKWTMALLERDGPTLLSELIDRVAEKIYQDEIRRGAAILDIGLFGAELFRSEVAAELRAGDGILWEIEGPEEMESVMSLGARMSPLSENKGAE